MRYSNTALRELKKRYKNILIKCALINTVALLTFAIPAGAEITYKTSQTLTGTITGSDTIYIMPESTSLPEKYKDSVLTIDANISNFTGTFKTKQISRNNLPNAFSTIIFNQWNTDSDINLTGNGDFIFADKSSNIKLNYTKESVERGFIYLGNNSLDQTSTSLGTSIISFGSKNSVETGKTIHLSNYNLKKSIVFMAGSLTTITSDINSYIKNSTFDSVIGNGNNSNLNGSVNLNVTESTINHLFGNNATSANDVFPTASYITGDINIDVSKSNLSTIIGQQFAAVGKIKSGLAGTINISVTNSAVEKSVRGASLSSGDYINWNNNYLQTNNIILNITNSHIGEELLGVGSYTSAKNVTINVLGNSTIGYGTDGNTPTGDGWIIAGTSRAGGTIQNTEINLNTNGSSNIIKVASHVEVGSRMKDGYNGTQGESDYTESVLGTATLNILGKGTVLAGDFRADHVKGKTTFNITDTTAIASGNLIGFDEINLNGTSTLNADTLTMSKNGIVNVVLSNKTNYSKINVSTLEANGAILNPLLTNEGIYNVVSVKNALSDFTWNLENNLYNLVEENGTITATLKSTQQLSSETGASAREASAILAIVSAENASTEKGNLLASAISEALQTGNASAAIEAAKTAAPTTAQVVTGIAKEASSTVSRISTNRMDSLKGRSGGDILHKAGLWMQGLYNHTKQDATTSSDGFKANSRGLALGVDKELTEETTVGIGYGYMKTDADSYGRDMNVDGHNFFLYGKYQPNQWYINSVLNYNYSKYTEKKYPLGIQLRSEYSVNSYGAELMSGYDLDNGLTPEMGFRYLLIDADSYDDGMQRVRSKRDDVLTAVAGIKYATRLKSKGILFKPSVKLAATYDVVSDNSSANILVSGGNSYNVDGSRLHRFGVEAGAGVTASLGNIDLTVEYNGAFRQDYKSQGGMIRARYNF